MPQVSTSVDLCQGHDACAARPLSTWSPDVTMETFPAARQGDAFEEHGCSRHPPHGAVVGYGWQTVLVNQRPVACVTATVTCASSVVGTGRPSVLVGEGARIRFG
jgi:uncharacterized Zn-binding protein involved in type VI secretion